jgi:hypothetical protein
MRAHADAMRLPGCRPPPAATSRPNTVAKTAGRLPSWSASQVWGRSTNRNAPWSVAQERCSRHETLVPFLRDIG